MHFDYVDIGTSDFETSVDALINEPNATVLLVEPLQFYLDKLPNLPNVFKENAAVSNTDGQCIINFVSPDLIEKHNLPWWVRGCNKVDERHSTVDNVLKANNLSEDLVQPIMCRKITFEHLCEKYHIESIGYLKIDTEGHEQYILPDVLTKIKNGFRINKIKFENQENIGNYHFLNELTLQFVENGYTITNRTYTDVTLEYSSVVEQTLDKR